jgi:hypothetical protein
MSKLQYGCFPFGLGEILIVLSIRQDAGDFAVNGNTLTAPLAIRSETRPCSLNVLWKLPSYLILQNTTFSPIS